MTRSHRSVALLLVSVLVAAACAPAAPSGSDSGTAGGPTPSTAGSPSPVADCLPVSAPEAAPWGERVWYEVFVRSFADADGDGIGDLRGLLGRLDYLNDGDPTSTTDLGVEGLWLMPIAEAVSYHGYDVTDERAVERDYGTLDDLRELLAAAHARGMRVIVDFIPNHTAREHPWFQDAMTPGSAHDDWYVWSATRPAWGGPSGEKVWHQAADRWYYGYFSEGMPDLNLVNPAVTAELEATARYWLDEVGVDGFRIDAAKHLIETGPKALTNTPETRAWLVAFRDSVRATRADAPLVGEVWEVAPIAGRYVPDALDLTFDFGFGTGVRLALENGRAGPLRTALSDSLRWWPANRNATFLSNHDQDRVMSQLRGDPASARLAAFLLLAAPGTPFLYYGEELGLEGRKPDERIRTPFPWDERRPGAGFTTGTPWEPLGEAPPGTSVAAQTDDPASLLSVYRTLIRARHADGPLRVGTTTLLETGSEAIAAWLRTTPEGATLVVANLSPAPVTDYAIDLSTVGPCLGPTATLLAAVGFEPDPPAVVGPSATGSGGLERYRPLDGLPGRSGVSISLSISR